MPRGASPRILASSYDTLYIGPAITCHRIVSKHQLLHDIAVLTAKTNDGDTELCVARPPYVRSLSFHLSIHFLIRPETGTVWLFGCVVICQRKQHSELLLDTIHEDVCIGAGRFVVGDGGIRRSGDAVAVARRSPPSVRLSGCAEEPEIGSGLRRRRFIECVDIPELPFPRRRRSGYSSTWGRKRKRGSICVLRGEKKVG
jgi:hypothetical protein